MRFFEFLLLCFLLWFIWGQVFRGWREAKAAERAAAANTGAHSRGATAPGGPAAPADPAAMTLVRCTSCGVHVPSGRTLPGTAGEVFCSAACQARGVRRTR
jgi:hypothetical protein